MCVKGEQQAERSFRMNWCCALRNMYRRVQPAAAVAAFRIRAQKALKSSGSRDKHEKQLDTRVLMGIPLQS